MLSLLHLVAALGVSLAATRFAIRIDNAQETVNVDTLVTLGSHVSFTCTDDGNSITGNILLVSDIATTLANASEGVWIINSMSVEDQGAYRCCVQSQCKDLAVITVPPDTTLRVVAAEREQLTLSCPLQIVKRFSQYYRVEWRVPVDRTVATSGAGVIVPWARLNDTTLELTVGPLNSSLPRVFECVFLSFKRTNMIMISNVPKGTVNITIPFAQQLLVTFSPSVIASGSRDRFNVSCEVLNMQMLYNAEYQFFFNGMPVGAPSKSSYTEVSITTTGNFTCNATQYSSLRTPIPSQLSPPVQAIVLDGPRLSAAVLHTVTDDDCMQEVTVSLQQPIPDEMYYTFSSVQTDSCVGLRGKQAVNITNAKSLMFTVNVGDSGLDTRQRMYLVSWFVMQDTIGSCGNVPLQRTAEACPPSRTIFNFTAGVIAGIVVASLVIFALLIIALTIGYFYGGYKGWKRRGILVKRRKAQECLPLAGLPLIVSRILVSLALATVPVDRTYNNKSFKFQSSGRQRIKYSHTWNIKGMIIETYYGGQPAREKLESIYSTKRTTGRQFQSVEDTFQMKLLHKRKVHE